MKRFCLLPAVIVSLALSIAGCDSGSTSSKKGPEQSEASKQQMLEAQKEMSKKAAQGKTTPPANR
jgi:hypothetical protein